jgi:hypothetical protein
VGDGPLATFEFRYAILTVAAFERLFRNRGADRHPIAPNPYGRCSTRRSSARRRRRRAGDRRLPVGACVGHFDGYPAMPVAVLMGQLAYLAGRLFVGTTFGPTGDPVPRGPRRDRPPTTWRGPANARASGSCATARTRTAGASAAPSRRGAHRGRDDALADDAVVACGSAQLTSAGRSRCAPRRSGAGRPRPPRRHRLGEVVPLPQVATQDLSRSHCACVSMPSATTDEVEVLGDARDRLDQRQRELRALARRAEVLDERAVDLDRVDGQVAQVGERRVAGAEVVDREPDAQPRSRSSVDVTWSTPWSTMFSVSSSSSASGMRPCSSSASTTES